MLLITGANGQLGCCLRDILSTEQALFTDYKELDITDLNAVLDCGRQYPLTGIINCAAYTNVDKAEEEPETARRINALGPENLAKMAAEQHIPLIHISTDYIFNGSGNTPLKESDPTRPLGEYGKSKLEGEEAVLKYAKTVAIIRSAWMYSPYGKNFVKTMLRLADEKPQLDVVCDQYGTPTYAPHLATAALAVLHALKPGQKEIYHFSNEGACSWYDLAYYSLHLARKNCRVHPILTKDYPTKAVRPAFSVLDKSKIKKMLSITIPHWTQGVEECLKKLF